MLPIETRVPIANPPNSVLWIGRNDLVVSKLSKRSFWLILYECNCITIPPSYILVRAEVYACGEEQSDTHTDTQTGQPINISVGYP